MLQSNVQHIMSNVRKPDTKVVQYSIFGIILKN
jgi:hypothetical protein